MRTAAILILAGVFLAMAMMVPGSVLAQTGKSVYDNNCAMCHGQDGRGNGPAASSFSPPPKDFNSSSFWQSMTKSTIRDTIENGHGPMPAINLSSSKINAVIAYMEEAFKK